MPITPVPETPPMKIARNAIDWRATLDALADDPGEWFKVDGPLTSNAVVGRERSLVKFAAAAGFEVEVTHRNVDGAHWIYARLIPKPAPKPAPAPKAAPEQSDSAPVVRHPTALDDATHEHQCDLCGDTFRTNTRLRQHQANAHKAS